LDFTANGVTNFQVNNFSQYKLAEHYEPDLSNLMYQDVLKLRIEASVGTGKCDITTDILLRNLLINLKNTNVGQ
jgi:hypothetical protein